MKKINILSLFDGISCGRVALERANIQVNKYYASEIDKYAIKVSENNYPGIIRLGDINNWKSWNIDWSSIDLILAGSPCQGFSFAGKQLAFNDPRSRLFFVFAEILEHIKSLNPNVKFLLENVRMKKEFESVITSVVGVEPVIINSDSFVQQNRERNYWFNWKLNKVPERKNWDGEFYSYRRTYFRKNKSGVCPCLLANMGTGGHNVPLKSMNVKDKLTPTECERLQTLPDDYTAGVSNTQRYKMLGNGWTVDVISHILSSLKAEFENKLAA